ncbi:hypothetical protein RI367_002102 [Sorochytrium milnesiophthora]
MQRPQLTDPSVVSLRIKAQEKNILFEGMSRAAQNPFCPTNNPRGILNMGVAEMNLMNDELLQKFNSFSLSLTSKNLNYTDNYGSKPFRTLMANFINDRFNARIPLNLDNITVHNGCGSAIDHLTWCIADQGDGVLIPSPYFGGFDLDSSERSRLVTIPVPAYSPYWDVTYEQLEQTYLDTLAKGTVKRIRAIIVCNPNNPLGKVYTKQEMTEFIRFAKKYELHLIVDEIYALSCWGETKFESVLSFEQELVDWTRTTVVWGISKFQDFACNGLRVGCNITYNGAITTALRSLTYFSQISSVTDHVLQQFFASPDYITDFLTTKNSRIRSAYEYLTTQLLDRHDIPYTPAESGFFCWVSLQHLLLPAELLEEYNDRYEHWIKMDPELYLLYKLLDGGVYLAVGRAFKCCEPGWFRWNYASSEHDLDMALQRVLAVSAEIAYLQSEWDAIRQPDSAVASDSSDTEGNAMAALTLSPTTPTKSLRLGKCNSCQSCECPTYTKRVEALFERMRLKLFDC